MKLTESAVKHPVTTTMLFAAMLLMGLISLSRLGLELFPDITFPTVVVYTTYPGVGPEEIEAGVTRPIENAVAALNGVKQITSTSSEGVTLIIVNFNWGTDMDNIVSEIREKIISVEDDFPEGVERPHIVRFNPEQLPTLVFNFYARIKGMDIRRLITNKVVPELEKIKGVAAVEIFGGSMRAVTCKLDLDTLAKLNIPITDVLRVFQGENINLPGGTLNLENQHLVIRTLGEFESIDDIGWTLVAYRDQTPIYLGDLAEIEFGEQIRKQFLRAGGYDGVQLLIRKQPGHNTTDVNGKAKAEVERLKKLLPPSLVVEIETDQSLSVLDSIGGVGRAAWQGGLLAIIVLLLFLRNLRSTVIVSVAIPISVVATFALMYFAGITMNILSLLGITVGIGMFVDNAIVVLESTFRKQLLGVGMRDAAVQGAGEVSRAITAATLTTVAVFLPLVFVEGLAGLLFRDLAYTISFALFISLLMALTLIPVLCSRFLKTNTAARYTPRGGTSEVSLADMELATGNRVLDSIGRFIQEGLRWLDDFYERVISRAIDHSSLVVGTAFVLLGLSVGSIFLMGMEFLPEADEGRFSVSLETRVGSPYKATEAKVIQVEETIMDILGDSLVSLSSAVGIGGKMTGASATGSHLGIVSVRLVGKDRREENVWRLVEKISSALRENVTDLETRIRIEGMSSNAAVATGDLEALVVEVIGDDLEVMHDWALKIEEAAQKVPGARDVDVSFKSGNPEIQLRVKREEAAGLGLNPREIALTIRTAYRGSTVTRFRQGEEEYDVVVLLSDKDRNNLDRMKNLFFINSSGTKILLENVVQIVMGEGPLSIERKNRSRVIRITASLTGDRALSRVMSDLRRRVGEMGTLPPGVRIEYSGAESQMKESFGSLSFALILAVALVYMVMASQFESFIHPLIVMFSIPFAIVGLVAALLVTDTTFSLVAFIGGIMLVGIVVNNAIVLIDYVNLLLRRGTPLREAIITAGKTRLKPILMTTFTTIFALLPTSLGWGTGAELRAPIGRAVIGGLTTSTLVTLVLIPTIFWLVESRRKRVNL
jgi:HAE1 family hydrophobic/amphiphilic exporter-1